MNQKLQGPPQSIRERLSKWSDRHKLGLWWETIYPVMAGILALVITLFMPIDQEKFESLVKNVGPTAVSVAAIFAGFQATIHAILLSMAKSRPMRSLKGSGHLRGLMSYVRWGTFTLVFFVAVSLAVIVMLTLGNLPARPRLFSAVLIGSFVLALVASFRIMNVMLKLLAKASGL